MDINMSLHRQMITFAVLVWVSMKFVFPSLNAALDERAKRIADGLAAADQGQQAMVMAEKRAGEALAGAREEASQRVATLKSARNWSPKKSKRMHKLKQTASLRKLKPKPSSNWPRRAKRCALRWLTWL
jgi:ATP synthase F0 subunit b